MNFLQFKESGGTVVVCAGMIRSGSTWLYNAVRLCLEVHNTTVYSGWVGDLDSSRLLGATHLVMKVHDPDAALRDVADFVFTSHRNIFEVVASAIDMGWWPDEDVQLHGAQSAMESHTFWKQASCLDVPYRRILNNKRLVITTIMHRLRLPCSDDSVNHVYSSLKALREPEPSIGVHDPLTLLHPRHRFGNEKRSAESSLDPTLFAKLDPLCKTWFVRNKYRPPRSLKNRDEG